MQRLLAQVRRFFEQDGESRFSPIKGDASDAHPKTIKRAGFVEWVNGSPVFYVLPETFKHEVCGGFGPKFAKQILFDKGYITSIDSIKKRIPGQGDTIRAYQFTSKVLGDDLDG